MELKRPLKRLVYVYGWRLRHWWFDTRDGARARIMACVIGALVGAAQIVRQGVAALAPTPPGQPHEAIIWFLVYLIVALLVAAAVMLSMHNNQPTPTQTGDTPTTDDGQSVRHHFGTVWVDDTFLLAWKITGKDAIKGDSGK